MARVDSGTYHDWSNDEREEAKRAATEAYARVQNGPAAGDLLRASQGENEDLLYGIYIILKRYREATVAAVKKAHV